MESEPEPRSELEDSSKEEPSEPSDNDSDNDNIMANPPQPDVERGPSIRLPWFTGKEEEQVEKYFRELKRLKAIYNWQDDHLLNMSLLGEGLMIGQARYQTVTKTHLPNSKRI